MSEHAIGGVKRYGIVSEREKRKIRFVLINFETLLVILGWRLFFYANERNEPAHIHCRKKLKELSINTLIILNSSVEQRNNYEVSPAGYGIHWPMIDEDLSIDGLLGIKHPVPSGKKAG